MRFFCSLFLLGAAGAAQAQAGEFGVRYWYSEGKTAWSHNAQMLNPSLGNPTSILTYDGLKAHSVELHGRKSFNDNLYIKGYAGFGGIKSGSLDDEDFLAGQVKFMDTTWVPTCGTLPMARRASSSGTTSGGSPWTRMGS